MEGATMETCTVKPSSMNVNQTDEGLMEGQTPAKVRCYRTGYKEISKMWKDMLLQEAKCDSTDSKDVPTTSNACVGLPSALYDQGDHEADIESEEYEGFDIWRECDKNADHSNFIKPHDFSMNHLPGTHHDSDIFNYIKLWAQLVVKVRVNKVSWDRPEGYAFYNHRGTKTVIRGTGKVADITRVDDTPCVCRECSTSSNPKEVWTSIFIMTAMHIVFDDSEVVETEIEFFYDDPHNKDNVKVLAGHRIVDSNSTGDWCKFECATHDLELVNILKEVDNQVLELGKIIKNKEDKNFAPLAVIASHPHGRSKHITIGEWKDKVVVRNTEENYEWTQYSYTTSTCFGCSGAPVWIIGPDRTHYAYNYYNHVHSRGEKQSGLNKSGAGDVEKRWDE